MTPPRDERHALYLISDGQGWVKLGRVRYHLLVGWKDSPLKAARVRCASLQCGNAQPLSVIGLLDLDDVHESQARIAERRAHEQLSAVTIRGSGEWFADTDAAAECAIRMGFTVPEVES